MGIYNVGIINDNVKYAIKHTQGPPPCFSAAGHQRAELIEGVNSSLCSVVVHVDLCLVLFYDIGVVV